MQKRIALLGLAAGLCMGVTCTITVPGIGNGNGTPVSPSYVPLDQADAEIIVSQQVGGTDAQVTATITDSSGRTVPLRYGQSVSVNGTALVGPDSEGNFTATIDAAGQHTIVVCEPTRGIEETTVRAPGDFAVTIPAEGATVSLSGFALVWSDPDDRFQVRIKLSQTVFGETQSVNFGPYTDTGTRTFVAEDLEPFVQGAELVITVTKIMTATNVQGFDAGTASVRVWTSRRAAPGP